MSNDLDDCYNADMPILLKYKIMVRKYLLGYNFEGIHMSAVSNDLNDCYKIVRSMLFRYRIIS